MTIPSGSNYTDISFKNSSGERRAFTRVTESDTAIDHCTQLYVKENSNQYPINFTISYSKDTGNVYAKINSNRINTITSSWSSDNLWYRVYDDGFIEQGGNFSIANDSYTTSVTFPKAFSNTNYVLTFGINSSSNSGTQFRHHGSISRTQTSFVTWANSTYITKSWHACGF